MENTIEVRNLSFTYEGYGDVPDVAALRDVSFTVEKLLTWYKLFRLLFLLLMHHFYSF